VKGLCTGSARELRPAVMDDLGLNPRRFTLQAKTTHRANSGKKKKIFKIPT